MRKYFEVKPGTVPYETAKKMHTFMDDWTRPEVKAEFMEELCITDIEDIECNLNILRLRNLPAIENVRAQFKSNRIRDRYEAKTSSDVNQKFLGIVKKYDLQVYTMFDFIRHFSFSFSIEALHTIRTNGDMRFFVEIDETKTTALDMFRKEPTLLPEIKEYEMLELQAQTLREAEKEAKEKMPKHVATYKCHQGKCITLQLRIALERIENTIVVGEEIPDGLIPDCKTCPHTFDAVLAERDKTGESRPGNIVVKCCKYELNLIEDKTAKTEPMSNN